MKRLMLACALAGALGLWGADGSARARLRALADDPATFEQAVAEGLKSPDGVVRRWALCQVWKKDAARPVDRAGREVRLRRRGDARHAALDKYLREKFPQMRADGSKNTYTDMADPEVKRIVHKLTVLNAATVPKDRPRFIGFSPTVRLSANRRSRRAPRAGAFRSSADACASRWRRLRCGSRRRASRRWR